MERNVGTPIPVGNFAGSVSIVPYQPKPNGGYKCTTCSPITAEARMLFFNNAMMLNISRAASGGCTLNRQSYYFFNVCHSERKRGCIRTCMRTHPLAGVFFPASASGFCSLLFNDDVPFSFCPPPPQNKIILVFPFPVPSRHHHRPPFFSLVLQLAPHTGGAYPYYYVGQVSVEGAVIPVCMYFDYSVGNFRIVLDGQGTCPAASDRASCQAGECMGKRLAKRKSTIPRL